MPLIEVNKWESASGQQAEGPPLWGLHGLRSLEFELSDAGVSISEARGGEANSGYGFEVLEALGVLALALEEGDLQWAERTLAGLDKVWQAMGPQPEGGGVAAVEWRAVWRVRAACRGWLYEAARNTSKAKSRSLRMEARRLRQACGG